ncbi:hypothetical protein KUTeg_018609 [Tegillarca granosa]|uniref:Uncharacterized protein n=1 Tax=Tegillarca granosa TaxID=220873 RepID=A0ABQ9EEP8_TEGGR|nr:hypothetical protein KUTeg_018609 [Tegillarca granosa]
MDEHYYPLFIPKYLYPQLYNHFRRNSNVAYKTTFPFETLLPLMVFGIGSALVYSPSILIVGRYFDKRRGFANGLFISACSLGGLVMPFFFRFVLDEYGLYGGMLMTSGLLSHIMIAGSLQRPPEFFRTRSNTYNKNITSSDLNINTKTLPSEKYSDRLGQVKNGEIKFHDETNLSASHPFLSPPKTGNGALSANTLDINLSSTNNSEPCLRDERLHPFSKLDTTSFRSFTELASISTGDIRIRSTSCETLETDNTNSKIRLLQCIKSLCDYEIVSNSSMNGALAFIFIPKFAAENGIDKMTATSMLSVIGGMDLIGRFTSGVLSDCKSIKNHHIIIVSQFISSLVVNCTHFFTEKISLFIFSGIFGLFSGMIFSLYPIMISDILGKDKLPVGLALAAMSQGISIAVTTPILGILRDVTGTYHATFHFVGATSFISVLLFIFTPCVHRYGRADSRIPASNDINE